MSKLLKMLFWLLLLVAIFIGLDQFFLQVPLNAPGLSQVQRFYVDFRGRLLELAGVPEQKQSIEQLIESTDPQRPEAKRKSPRYLYVDENGALQFADSFEQVPPRFRKDAQPLAE